MKRLLILSIVLFSLACKTEEVEPEILISEIDGDKSLSILDGEMNTKKATHLILMGEGKDIEYTFKRAISDSLQTEDSLWRNKYFDAINTTLRDLDTLDLEYIGANIFSYFLHNPEEFMNKLNKEAFDNSDIWMNLLAKEYAIRTSPDDISINSVINLAHKYCVDCSDEQKENIIGFVEMLSLYEE